MPKATYSKGDAEAKMHDKLMGMEKTDYPSTIQLDEDDLPEVKDWKVGETYEVTLKIKEVGSWQGAGSGPIPMDDSDADKVHAKFEVVKAEYKSPEEDKTEGGEND